ncbi:hypothetical protein [Streptomyces sp. ADI93-02]|uniref:hypothetical protein n=1 Tax=Streptomyces sp. ADI93-02 TaxID=1522757 RepID=UPI0032163AD7
MTTARRLWAASSRSAKGWTPVCRRSSSGRSCPAWNHRATPIAFEGVTAGTVAALEQERDRLSGRIEVLTRNRDAVTGHLTELRRRAD